MHPMVRKGMRTPSWENGLEKLSPVNPLKGEVHVGAGRGKCTPSGPSGNQVPKDSRRWRLPEDSGVGQRGHQAPLLRMPLFGQGVFLSGSDQQPLHPHGPYFLN